MGGGEWLEQLRKRLSQLPRKLKLMLKLKLKLCLAIWFIGKVFLDIVFPVPCRIPFKWGVLLIHSFNASMSLWNYNNLKMFAQKVPQPLTFAYPLPAPHWQLFPVLPHSTCSYCCPANTQRIQWLCVLSVICTVLSVKYRVIKTLF